MKNLLWVMAAVAVLACGPAFAQRPAPAFAPGWYIGIGVGEAKLGTSAAQLSDTGGATMDDTDRAIALRAGFRMHPNLAVELGYYDFGEYRYDGLTGGNELLLPIKLTGSAKARSLGVSLVAILPLDRVDLYGRLGYARSELKTRAELEGIIATGPFLDPRTRRDNEIFGGVGARYNLNREFGVFAEYQRHDKLEIDAWMVGVDLRF